MNGIFLVIATFLASAVESVEMVAIVVGVGAVRGWRSTWIGSAAGFVVLAGIVFLLGAALRHIPIQWLRLFIGALLLIFGLQWLKKALVRIAGSQAHEEEEEDDEDDSHPRPSQGAIDWYAFVLAFKGVLLEGLEIAFIVVTFGAEAKEIWLAGIGALAAFVVVAGIGLGVRSRLSQIPREWLRFGVGILLTTFGTFWSAQGAGVQWPGKDLSLLILLSVVIATAFGLLALLHRTISNSAQVNPS